VRFDSDDKVFYGKIEGVNDLVTFEGDTVDDLIKSFKTAVKDYARLCRKVGKEPFKSCKGSFNVRIPPGLHKKVVEQATRQGISLNQFVQKAIEHEVSGTKV
jgi:predicted HicB family RNase H-like nuclease